MGGLLGSAWECVRLARHEHLVLFFDVPANGTRAVSLLMMGKEKGKILQRCSCFTGHLSLECQGRNQLSCGRKSLQYGELDVQHDNLEHR